MTLVSFSEDRFLDQDGEYRFEGEKNFEALADIFRIDRQLAYQGPPPP